MITLETRPDLVVESEGAYYNVVFQQGPVYTVCSVYGVYPPAPASVVLISAGTARCSAGDVFDAETGKRVALKRAVADLPRPLRSKILRRWFGRSQAQAPVSGYIREAARLAMAELEREIRQMLLYGHR